MGSVSLIPHDMSQKKQVHFFWISHFSYVNWVSIRSFMVKFCKIFPENSYLEVLGLTHKYLILNPYF